jgi:NAD(P)-dependent dehydrogenase (short-subunit alcohol dehydrogenase family)
LGITLNLKGSFNVAQTFLKYASQDAVLIETNSAVAHVTVSPGVSSYSVAKAATARFYSYLAFEHPELSIFSVSPGLVKTDGWKTASEGDAEVPDEIFDDVSLPASFNVWVASPEARFLKGKYVWANWDVDELKQKKSEIESTSFLNMGVIGWPFPSA